MEAEATTGTAERLPYFDPYLRCTHPAVVRHADAVHAALMAAERPDRKRALREADKAIRKAMLDAIFANLAFALASGRPRAAFAVAVRAFRPKLTRYRPAGFKGMPRLLKLLTRHRFVTFEPSRRKGTGSTVGFGPGPAERDFAGFAWGRKDYFGQAPGREMIILKARRGGGSDESGAGGADEEDDAQAETESGPILLEYTDTAETVRLREEMAGINAALIAAAPVLLSAPSAAFTSAGRGPLRRYFQVPTAADAQRFDQGGRLFGGMGWWWLNLPKARRKDIRIQGEPVATIDFASMMLRLAYLKAGHEPPPGDLYALGPGRLSEARWRPFVKQATSALLFASRPLQRLPKGMARGDRSAPSLRDIRGAVAAHHPAVVPLLEVGAGMGLMKTESDILVAALLKMAAARIAALPLHDAVLAPRSQAMAAAEAMSAAAQQVTGFRLPLTIAADFD